jgi:hypothetical protein
MVRVQIRELLSLLAVLDLVGVPESEAASRRLSIVQGRHGFSYHALIDACRHLGLRVSLAHLGEVLGQRKSDLQRDIQPIDNESFLQQLPTIADTVRRELSTKLLLALPEEASVDLYANERPFDTANISVNDAFPAAIYDIQEAANCLALSRSTACVCI